MPRKPPPTLGFAQQLLLDAVVGIGQAPDAAEIAYMARQLVQCTLPHSDPGNYDSREWNCGLQRRLTTT